MKGADMRYPVALLVILAALALSLSSCSRTDQEGEGSGAGDGAAYFASVDNEFFPLVVGTIFHYGSPDGSQRVEVAVTDEQTQVMGVTCTVVETREYEDDVLVELTRDSYAQDASGAVWYFAEDTHSYSADGSESSTGSWTAGVDGAEAGVVMPGDPKPGEPYRVEYYKGHAEDMAQIEELDGRASVPCGSFDNAAVVKVWTPLEPGVVQYRYYAKGVGLVLQEEGSSRLELVDVASGGASSEQ
jgi:hypothetical protein